MMRQLTYLTMDKELQRSENCVDLDEKLIIKLLIYSKIENIFNEKIKKF